MLRINWRVLFIVIVAFSGRRFVFPPRADADDVIGHIWTNGSAGGRGAGSRRPGSGALTAGSAQSDGTMAAVAAAAGSCASSSVAPGGKKPPGPREQSRRNRENSRRRQAALLFLTNISLDGRPLNNVGEGGHPRKDTELDPGSVAGAASSTYGTFSGTSTNRAGLLTVPPILVLPSDAGFNDTRSAEVLLGCRRGSFPSSGNSNLLTPSPSDTSLLPSPLGPRKSSTLLSVQSCNSVSSELRQR